MFRLFWKRGTSSKDSSNRELRPGGSHNEDLRIVKIQKLFQIIEKEKSEQDIIDEIDACLKNGADINGHNDAGNTVLDIAEQKNYQSVAKFLLERGVVRGNTAARSGPAAPGGTTPRPSDAPGVSNNVSVNNSELNCDITLKELLIDNKLNFGCENYQSLLKIAAKDSRRMNEKLTLDPYPSAHTLALLALKVYSDTPGDMAPPELPRGWKLLTTASNPARSNGYFGAAFWCRSQQQVVVAHRGTEITNTGAILTNYKSIIYYKNSPHMQSAITFTDSIASALRKVNMQSGVSFHLSITGHSLGGWLGQVTAFTVKYLKRDKLTFKRISNIRDGFHAHTVVFDSPGCRTMLSKMKEKFDLRYERLIFLRRLDISSYLSAPNRINSLNLHLGIIYRVMTNLSNVNVVDEYTPGYTTKTHSMENMVKALSGLERPKIVQMLDWPLRSVIWGEEYNKFFKSANRKNEYHHQTNRYEFKEISPNCCSLRTFSEDELRLLDSWEILKKSKMNLTNLIKVNNLIVCDLFDEFVINKEKQIIECTSEESLIKVIRHTRALMRWFPAEVLAATRRQAELVPSSAEALFRAERDSYLRTLKRSRVDFKDTIGLEAFLTSGNNILIIRTLDGDMEMTRFLNIFHQIKKKWELPDETIDRYSFMDLKTIKKLESAVNIQHLFQSYFTNDHLIFMQNTECSDENFESILQEISTNLKNNPNNKLVFIKSHDAGFEELLNIGNNLILKHTDEVKLSDLTETALEILFEQKIILLQGEQLSLREFIGEYRGLTAEQLNRASELIGPQMLKKLLYFDIEMKDVLLHHNDLNVHSTINKEVSMESIAQVLKHYPDALLVISNMGREKLGVDPWKQIVRSMEEVSEGKIFTTAGDGESSFKIKCQEEPSATIYWFSELAGLFHCKAIYKREFYIKRRFAISKYIFDFVEFVGQKNEDNKIIQNAKLVFQNVNKQTLMSRCLISVGNKDIFLSNDDIKTVASGEEADDIIKKNPDRPVHVLKQETNGGPILWQRSRGSLEGLRPYVTTEIDELIDERNLRNTRQKVVIIADEPGMGKSTTLTSMSRLLQPAWIIRVDLKDFHLHSLPITLCLNSVCKFILIGQSDWLRGLFQFCLDKDHEHSRIIYIFFDGFDEIKRDTSPSAEDKVLKLLEYLNNETKARVWVTTRLYRKEILENSLSTFAMRFERIREIQQREFLTNFWRPHLLLEVDNYEDAEKEELDKCAESVYKNAKEVLGDDVQNFMGIPLQMRMLAEVCLPRVKDYLKSNIDIENIFDIKNVLHLYQRFVNLRYEIYFSDKTGLNERMGAVIKNMNTEQLTEKHRMLGLRTLFPKFAEEYFDGPEDGWEIELCRVGLVQVGGGGRGSVEFTHRTLAEFYCAELVVEWLRRRGRYHGHAPMIELLLTEILLHKSNRVIRIFVDSLVLSESLSEEANKFSALRMSELWRERQHSLFIQGKETALHVAVREGSTGIVDVLVEGFQCAPEQLIGFLAARSRPRPTALYQAARAGRSDIVQKIVGSVERCSYNVILELLLATYVGSSSVSENGIKSLSDYLQGTAICPAIKEALTRTTNIIQEYIPRFHTAVRDGVAERVGEVCREVTNGTEMLYTLLAPGRAWKGGDTALHCLARAPRDEEEDTTILAHVTTTLRNQTISAVGRAYGEGILTPLHRAAAAGRLALVEWLINHGVWVDSPAGLGEMTALYGAVGAGNLPVARYLIEKGADINILNRKGENLMFAAARGDSLPLLQYLIDKGLNVNTVNNEGENLLHYTRSTQVRDFLEEQIAQREGSRLGGEV